MNFENSIRGYEKAKNLAPAGVHSPVRAFGAVGGTPIFFEQGEGAILTDIDGNRYIDFCMSWGALAAGHAHPKVVSKVCAQVAKGTHFGTPTLLDVELAEMICQWIAPMDRIRFVNSGTEAVMTAVRLARGITTRHKIVKIHGAYHGHLDSLLVAAGSGLVTQGKSSSAGVTPGTVQDTLVIPYDNEVALEEVFRLHKDEIAGVIIEPILANNGLFEHKLSYLKKLRQLCTDNCALLIFDEVITGFRVAKGGAQELYGIEADIATYGKVIGGGMPIGAVAAKKAFLDRLAPTGDVYQAGTLSGNPVGMAAGIATMQALIDGGFYDRHIQELGDYFDQRLTQACNKAKIPMSFRRVKAIFWLCPGADNAPASPEQIHSKSVASYAQLFHHFLNKGLYIAPSAYEVGFLTLSHTREHLDRMAEAIETYEPQT